MTIGNAYHPTELDVALQDQTTPAVIFPLNRITNSTDTTSATVIGEYTVDVTATTGIVEQTVSVKGTFLIIYSSVTNRVYKGRVLDVTGSTLTLDRPFDSVFPIGADVDVTTTEMNVDGSTTPVVFGLRGASAPSQVAIEVDVTRLMFLVITDTVGGLEDFGDLTSLTKGVLIRTRDSLYQNLFQIKNNGELAVLCYDVRPYLATNPAQGVNGYTARLSFAGQNKLGVAIRLAAGEDLEILIQDDLRGLFRFGIVAEGHVVD